MGKQSKQKPTTEERISRGKEVAKNDPKGIEEVKKFVVACLNELCDRSEGYEGKSITYSFTNPENGESYSGFRNRMRKEEGELFFIEFSEKGHVVVGGAGYDFRFQIDEKYLNRKILNAIEEGWGEDVIFILVKGLKQVGKYGIGAGMDGCKMLQCRNGVEMFIGEYLLKRDVPILNEYQHKNYTEEFFENNI